VIFIFIAAFILAIFVSSYFVSAQSPVQDIKAVGQGISDILESIFTALLGPGPTATTTSVGQGGFAMGVASYLFARVIFLLIIFCVVWAVVGRIPIFEESKWIAFIISAGVGLLSTRFLLQPEWIQTILLPYTAVGIAITTFIPLFVYFYFVEEGIQSKVMRKIAWILAAVVFVGLWYSRYRDLTFAVSSSGNSSFGITGPAAFQYALYIYPIAAAVCILCLLLDGTIQGAWKRAKQENALSATQYALYGQYMQEIKELMHAQAQLPGGVGAKEYKSVQKKIEDLQKKAAKIIP